MMRTSYPAPSILIVGLGMSSQMLLGSAEAQKVAAHLEARGVNSQLTLLDVSPKVMEDVQTRRTLYVNPYGSDTYKSMVRKEWSRYLTDTSQTQRVVHTPEVGLNFDKTQINRGSSYVETCLKAGVWSADVPASFHTGIATGSIRLLNADVARADLSASQPFDFAEMTNIFWLLSRPGQQLALENVAGHMKKGGKILVNDIKSAFAFPPMFAGLGGWLTTERLNDLNLKVQTVLDQGPSAIECVLVKI